MEQPAFQTTKTEIPKGGASIKGMGESFQAGGFTGGSQFSIPVPLPDARGIAPQIGLAYHSGSGNGSFGMGISLGLLSISRKTSKGIPLYNGQDVFLLGQSELVPNLDEDPYTITEKGEEWKVTVYRPRIESDFSRIEQYTDLFSGDMFWIIRSGQNTTTILGKNESSRIYDPAHPTHIFEWFIEEESDPNGNRVVYNYRREDLNGVLPTDSGRSFALLYPDTIQYGNYFVNNEESFAFELQFQYSDYDPDDPLAPAGKWEVRPDSYSTFNSGFEVRNYRLCKAIKLYHQLKPVDQFHGLNNGEAVLSSVLKLVYEQDEYSGLSFLKSVNQWAYRLENGSYQIQEVPALELKYQDIRPTQHLYRPLQLESEHALPGYLWNGTFSAADLHSEGLPGFILSNEQTTLYWEPLGDGRYRGPEVPEQFPINKDLQNQGVMLTDLEGNGYKSLVTYDRESAGYYATSHQGIWEPFVAFAENVLEQSTSPANQVDLTGDGWSDLIYFEQDYLRWYPSLGKKGYGTARLVKLRDGFPAVSSNSQEELITFADMNGDGLSDWVKIVNGTVMYWPNKGYGDFSHPVPMQQAPVFPQGLNVNNLHLADIDGSGTTDIIYLKHGEAIVWFNQSGNRFSEPVSIPLPFNFDQISEVNFADVLGNGTNCMVLTRIEPEVRHVYFDFSGGKKPYLLKEVSNNMGSRYRFRYSTSVQQYLEDKRVGRVGATRLSFPVQVVSEVISEDEISRSFHLSRYRYHDGYFDPEERVFRGFGFVESWDTDHYESLLQGTDDLQFDVQNLNSELYVPPTYGKTWYHTGAYSKEGLIEDSYRKEYFKGDPNAGTIPVSSFSPEFATVDAESYRQAFVALEGQLLRSEVYGLDGSDKEDIPFTVSQTSVHVRLVQARQQNRYAVVFPYQTEQITWEYERKPHDPRVSHSFNLEMDEYGNVTKSAAVSYPRRPQDERAVFPEQEELHMMCNLSEFASLIINQPSEDELPCRWTGVSYEDKSFQIKTAGMPSGLLTFDQVKEQVDAALQNTIPYHQLFDHDVTPQARWLGHSQNYFWLANQRDAAPLGQISYRLLPHHQESTLGSAELYNTTFGDKINDSLLTDQCGYFQRDDNWWQNSPVIFYYNKPEQFYLPYRWENIYAANLPPDPITGLGSSALFTASSTAYDPYFLYGVESSSQLSGQIQLTTTAEMDYQSLLPWRVTDANQNVQEVLFDALGEVIVSSVYGQIQEGNVGNEPISNYQLQVATFDEVLANPSAYIQQASSYYYYDLLAWRDRQQPVCFISLVGEKYVSQLESGEENQIQISVVYNDGFGRTIETKQKTDAGPVQIVSEGGVSHNPVDQESWSEERWIVSGRTVYNNKGMPAQQYLPYFSAFPGYEDQSAIAMEELVPPPAVLHYDAVNRVICTDDPKGFFTKVEFTPWKTLSFDANDTLAESKYYQEYNGRLPDPEQQALNQALACTHTPSTQIMDNLGRVVRSIENNLGVLRLEHLEEIAEENETTPDALFDQLVEAGIIDPLDGEDGVLSEATLYWNQELVEELQEAFGPAAPGLLELLYNGRMTTLNIYDIDDNVLMSIDPRLYYYNISEGAQQYNLRYTYNMPGQVLYSESCDAGEAWGLSNMFGQAVSNWDSRGFRVNTFYDNLQRPLLSQVLGGDGNVSLNNITQKLVYGETIADAVANNLMGQVYQSFDEAGLSTVNTYGLGGEALEAIQQLRSDYKNKANWTTEACEIIEAEEELFITTQQEDALGRLLWQNSPDGSTYTPSYNRTGAFKSALLNYGQNNAQTIVRNVEYDAQGHPVQVDHGNSVISRYGYEATTNHLLRLTSYRQSEDPPTEDALLQDLRYWYDPAGNITQKNDRSWQTVFNANQQVEPQSLYHYDALYRLIKATGRQLAYTGSEPPNAQWLVDKGIGFRTANANDPKQLENFTERYSYDLANNMLALQHRASHNWTYRFSMAPNCNRLAAKTYDANGNMLQMDHLKNLSWDYRNNLASADMVVRKDGSSDSEYYVYSSSGTRVRKVTERLAANGSIEITDTIYLGSFERKTVTITKAGVSNTILLRETLKVQGAGHASCIVHHWLVDTQGRETNEADKWQFRFHLDDMQGSVSMELSQTAELITYEEYFPYGNTALTVGANQVEVQLKIYRYSGQERDATGLYYYGARYYPPWLCRWLKPDPAGTIDGLNLYAFVGGNPVTKVDVGGYSGRGKGKKTSLGKRKEEAQKLISPSPKKNKSSSVDDLLKDLFKYDTNKPNLTPENIDVETGEDWEKLHAAIDKGVAVHATLKYKGKTGETEAKGATIEHRKTISTAPNVFFTKDAGFGGEQSTQYLIFSTPLTGNSNKDYKRMASRIIKGTTHKEGKELKFSNRVQSNTISNILLFAGLAMTSEWSRGELSPQIALVVLGSAKYEGLKSVDKLVNAYIPSAKQGAAAVAELTGKMSELFSNYDNSATTQTEEFENALASFEAKYEGFLKAANHYFSSKKGKEERQAGSNSDFRNETLKTLVSFAKYTSEVTMKYPHLASRK